MAFVYWIHLDEHTDITKEGYIGITTMSVEDRYKRHLYAARKERKGRTQRIIHCMRKYADRLRVVTLLEADLDYCRLMEERLRPEEKIGWNLAKGGSSTRAGCKNSPEHNRKVAEFHRGRKHSQERIEANRERGKKQMAFSHPWEHPYSNKEIWARADEIYLWFEANPRDGRRTVAVALNMPSDSVLNPLKKIKSGWIPTEDPEWLKFKNQREQGCQDAS